MATSRATAPAASHHLFGTDRAYKKGHRALRTLRVLTAAALVVTCIVGLAPRVLARHRAALGIGTCDGPSSTRTTPGSSVTVAACFTDTGQALAGHRVIFVLDRASPQRSAEAVTDARGLATVVVSDARPGRTRVSVCDQDLCVPPVTVSFAPGGAEPPDDPAPPPSITSGTSVSRLEPVVTSIPAQPDGEGFACAAGPGVDRLALPAFASVDTFTSKRLAHPRGSGATDAIQVVTGQNVTAGAAIYSVPSSIFVAIAERGIPTDPSGPFPLRGSNSVLVFFTNGGSRFGKSQLSFDDGVWKETKAAFTVALEHSTVTFYSDRGAFPKGRVAAGSRIDGRCDGAGFGVLTEPRDGPSAEPSGDRSSPMAVATGVGLLLLLGALAFAVIRSSQPPSGGGLPEHPPGPPVYVRREELQYDAEGRLKGYREVVELPGSAPRTVRGRVLQEDLVVDQPLLLDSSDWDDEVIETRRDRLRYDQSGHLLTYDEESISPDGTVQRSTVDNIVFDRAERVVRYRRITSMGPGARRSETVVLEHGEVTDDGPSEPLQLAPGERMQRHDLRFDEEDHVAAYSAVVSTIARSAPSEAKQTSMPVPKALFESGLRWPSVPWFASYQTKGIDRTRNVFTRWFRRHGCMIQVDPPGDGVEVAGQAVPADDGPQTLWAFAEGDYPVTSGGRLVGWVAVRHIPGKAEVKLG